ncbi:MAG: hypothetical protein KKB81_08105 [Candidatus Margulisbacteria bacterium]|nr:hypothetical protein [Candidatus Margulisiibacteriota bacterium]MBU1021742.1 hypothetical protein [Candidatus Margulisiibacteriota bacterium]MBU1729488.1 hypothetical protein [Candidatus Margulisiibacteriota bacterium]MBU1955411.1 hypothetical protein [Candidatus Margulisiibacteriota bacterium]
MKKELKVNLINSSLLILTLAIGFFALYLHNDLLPYLYLVLAAAIYVSNSYFCCTRCEKYGKVCYTCAGLFAKKFFRRRENKAVKFDDEFYVVSMLVLILAPLPFLLYYQDWLFIILYVVVATVLFWYKHQTVCKDCGNSWCMLRNN